MNLRWTLPLVLVAACDNSARNEQIASVDKKVDDGAEARAAELKRKRAEEAQAKADEDDRIHQAIVKIAVAPESPPKALAEACQAVADAQDRFVERLGDAGAKSKWTASRESDLPMSIIACSSNESVVVAGCQANALDQADATMKDRMQEILDVCVSKFAKPRAGGVQAAGMAIPKRPQ